MTNNNSNKSNTMLDRELTVTTKLKRYSISTNEAKSIAMLDELKRECKKNGRSFSFAIIKAVSSANNKEKTNEPTDIAAI
jgi:hypothetical protein